MAFGLVAIVLIFWNLMQNTADQQKLRVACVGDELTFGTDVEDREDNCYPVQLQKYMEKAEKKYRIGNFGVEGAAVQKKSKKPYTKEERYESSTEYKANLVVIMLGTNDTTEENWTDIDTFQKDYQSLIKNYQDLKSSPEVWLVTPPMDETYHMINRESIQKMKDGVILVNTSRGGLVKTADLIEGIRARKFFAVGLDVYEEEKKNVFEDRSDEIMETSITARLLSFPNVIITSHQGFFTYEALDAISETTLNNAMAFTKGERTGNEVEVE